MNYNKVIIMGHLVGDPVNKNAGGKNLADFSIAVNTGYGDKKTVNFFQCVAWEKTGETITKYCAKGDCIQIEGELRQQTWEKDGKKNSRVFITVFQVVFIKKKEEKKQAPPQAPQSGSDVPDWDDATIPF